ncbi:hypothetical protein [Pseudonocardia sediminis]|nr:hypothetical protein [Pseudonocardia sediminis]
MTTSPRRYLPPDPHGRVTATPGDRLTRRRHVDLVRIAGYVCR